MTDRPAAKPKRPRKPTPDDRIPEIIIEPRLDDYLAVMTRAVFQAGVSWALIDSKWDAFRTAFHDFDPHSVAAFDDLDLERLANDEHILRSRRKIEGTIQNARTLLALDREHGGFRCWLAAFENYDQASAALRNAFRFLGELSVYYLLFRTGHDVPPFEQWELTIEGDHPRMREMVRRAREHA